MLPTPCPRERLDSDESCWFFQISRPTTSLLGIHDPSPILALCVAWDSPFSTLGLSLPSVTGSDADPTHPTPPAPKGYE